MTFLPPASPEVKDVRAHNFALANEYVSFGIGVFPSRAEDKKPLVKWRTESAVLFGDVTRLWDRFPDGIPTINLQLSNLIVVDADRHPGGQDGVTALRELFRRHAFSCRDVPVFETPGCGVHVYFSNPKTLGTPRGKLPSGVEIKSAVNCIMAAGAMLPDGRMYRGLNARAELPINQDLPPLPEWLEELAYPPRQEPVWPPSPVIDLDRYGDAIIEGELSAVVNAPPGQGNHQLCKSSFIIGKKLVAKGQLDQQQAETMLYTAAVRSGLVQRDGHVKTMNTIRFGIRDAARK